MKIDFDIREIVAKGEIQNELDLERALIVNRKLRVLAKNDPKIKEFRKKLVAIISSYEEKHWSKNSEISEEKIKSSDIAEIVAEKERQFIKSRKKLIKGKLDKLNINQQELGEILGHKKSYMSELINGIRPFSLKDLIVINKILQIDLTALIPTFLPEKEQSRLKASIDKLGNPNLKIS